LPWAFRKQSIYTNMLSQDSKIRLKNERKYTYSK